MTGEYLFDELNRQAILDAEREELNRYVAPPDIPPVKYKSEANRIAVSIMATLDCIISDAISDMRYDMAQTRVEKIIEKELSNE